MTFQPGQSGNPAGRPRGARNKRTILAEQLFDDHAGEVTQAAIELALRGNSAALRVCMDRLLHPPLDFDFPQLRTAADAVVAINAIAQGLAHGELDPRQATVFMQIVQGFLKALEAVERISAQSPQQRAAVATTTQETSHDDHILAFPPSRPNDRADDHAAHAGRPGRGCGALREAPRRRDGEHAPDQHHRGDVGARFGRQLLGDRAATPL